MERGTAARRLLALFESAGFEPTDVPVLQPAELFVTFAGEDLRRRLYLTQGPGGEALCLRPEFTLPLVQAQLGKVPGERRLAYAGPVFRQRSGEPGEFLQAGVESFGRMDAPAADADLLALALAAQAELGLATHPVRLGDAALLETALSGLGIAGTMARRVRRALVLARPLPAAPVEEGTPRAAEQMMFAGLPLAEATARVEALVGESRIAGRTAAEIAERLTGTAAVGMTDAQRSALEGFLAIAGDPDEVAAGLRAWGESHGCRLDSEIEALEARVGFMAALGVDVTRLRMETRFLRSLDYYTGMIFEVVDPVSGRTYLSGGRYDRVATRLGAPQAQPALGFSLDVDRALAAGLAQTRAIATHAAPTSAVPGDPA